MRKSVLQALSTPLPRVALTSPHEHRLELMDAFRSAEHFGELGHETAHPCEVDEIPVTYEKA